MKTTVQGVLLEVGGETARGLDRLMRKYGFMVRYAFKRLLESGTKGGQLERIVAAETGLPLRCAKDAVAEARQLIASQKALVRERLELWQRRKRKTVERIDKIAKKDPHSRKLPGLRSKLEKQQRKVAFYQQHAEQSTFPPVIFGSRGLYLSQFKEGVNQAAWRQAWDDARNGRLVARGDRTKQGNPLLRIHEQDGAWRLEISLGHGEAHGKSLRYDKLKIPLYVPRKISKTTGAINGRDYVVLLRRAIERGDPYQSEILRKRGVYHVHITVEEMPAELIKHPVNGWVGMDANPTRLALCHVRPDGNPAAFAHLKDGQLYDARSGRREWLIGNLARQVVSYKDWLAAKQTFNETAYRKTDWSIWRQAKKAIEKTLMEKGGSLVSWLDQRKGLLQG